MKILLLQTPEYVRNSLQNFCSRICQNSGCPKQLNSRSLATSATEILLSVVKKIVNFLLTFMGESNSYSTHKGVRCICHDNPSIYSRLPRDCISFSYFLLPPLRRYAPKIRRANILLSYTESINPIFQSIKQIRVHYQARLRLTSEVP